MGGMGGMMDPRLRQMMQPGMGAPPGPISPVQLTPGFRSPPLMGGGAGPAPKPAGGGMNPMALLGMAQMMGGGNSAGGGKSIGSMDPASFAGVIGDMSGGDAQKYLGGLPGQGNFIDWLKRNIGGLF